MSCLSAAFHVADHAPPARATFDGDSRPALERYVAQSEKEEERVRGFINELVDSKRPIVVWGVGTHATHLLETTRLSEANIRFFVDSNARYHGKELAGRRVMPPVALQEVEDPVLILSRVFQTEIAEQIRATVSADREILTLYDIA
jgi:hypothetical protein